MADLVTEKHPETPEEHVEAIEKLITQAREMRRLVDGWRADQVNDGLVRERQFTQFTLEDLENNLDAALMAARVEIERRDEARQQREWAEEVHMREYAR